MSSNNSIAKLAYQLWIARGRPHGSEEEDWLEAERQLAGAEDQGASRSDPPVDETDDAPATAPGDIGEGPSRVERSRR
jgi:hypothetical protein